MNFSHCFQAFKKKKKVEGAYSSFFIYICVSLRGLLSTQEWDWCCAWWLTGSCGASYHLSLHWCLPAGAEQVSLKSQALDLQLTFQVHA